MKLAVVSHKLCWNSAGSASGYATDGGFPFQLRALSELFDATTLVVPCTDAGNRSSEVALVGHNLSVRRLTPLGSGLGRRVRFPFWLLGNGPRIVIEILRADAVHAPVPGDIGTIGILIAFLFRKPLLVRHCGNWSVQRSTAERFWRWMMERLAGGRNVMLATGGAAGPPSLRNPNVRWIFSTSLTERDLRACNRQNDQSPCSAPKLIIIGRQERGKGTDLVIKSLPIIMEDFPGATLDVVGHGEALSEFQKLASTVGVQDRVTFHGKVDHDRVMSLLQGADLFCFPTSSEGFPKAVLEALACGLPVVTTKVSVLPELIGTGCGVLVENATPVAVAQAVKSCLSDADRYRAMSGKAIETAKQYSLERWQETIGSMLRVAWGPLKTSC
jgi:glycosyltransferase involved in cell wall biosynthesis